MILLKNISRQVIGVRRGKKRTLCARHHPEIAQRTRHGATIRVRSRNLAIASTSPRRRHAERRERCRGRRPRRRAFTRKHARCVACAIESEPRARRKVTKSSSTVAFLSHKGLSKFVMRRTCRRARRDAVVRRRVDVGEDAHERARARAMGVASRGDDGGA